MQKIVIIGQGPAGISAALYAVRSGLDVTILAKDGGALQKADRIEHYHAFSEGISAAELIDNGIRQAKKLGVNIVNSEVVGIEFADNGYSVKTIDGEYAAGAIVIACGTSRNVPPIRNIERFEGSGVSYCAICDGFFFRGKKVAVIGNSSYAASEFNILKNIIEDVTILTNGTLAQFELPHNAEKIVAFEGTNQLEEIVFENGRRERFDGVFIACGSAGAFELAKKLGLEINGNKIAVNAERATNLPGIFAAGDCIPGLQQIAKAVYDGMIAGTQSVKYLKSM